MTNAASPKADQERKLFDDSIKALESQIASVGAHLAIDASTRLAYGREIKAMAAKLEAQALAGKITWVDKLSASRREVVSTGAGVAGSVAAGALAGLACGPGAPVCVTIGAFVGGALAAYGASFML